MPDWNPRPLCYTTELHTKSSIAESDLYLAIFSSTLANNKIYGPPLHPLQMLLAALIHSEAVKSKTVPAAWREFLFKGTGSRDWEGPRIINREKVQKWALPPYSVRVQPEATRAEERKIIPRFFFLRRHFTFCAHIKLNHLIKNMSLHGNLEVCFYLLFLSANIQHGLQNFGKRYVLLLALCLMNKNYKTIKIAKKKLLFM